MKLRTRIAHLLSVALLIVPSLGASTALGREQSNDTASNKHCFSEFYSCRTACITEDTRYFWGGVIDWSTNFCLLDCDLTLATCISVAIGGVFGGEEGGK